MAAAGACGGWAAPGLTDVRFRRDDPAGEALAYAANAPVWAVAHLCAAAYARREVRAGLLLAGLAGNHALSYALKRAVAAPRPRAHCEALGTCASFGMPSTHAQFAAFLAGHALLRARRRPGSALRLLEALALAALAAAVALSRVYLGYHTPGQVAAGGALGLALGALWAAAVERAGAAGWLRRLERSELGETLLLKDSEGAPPRTDARRPPRTGASGPLGTPELLAERHAVLLRGGPKAA